MVEWKIDIGTIIIFWIHWKITVVYVEFLERQKGWYQFYFFTYCNILATIKRRKYPILSTRRKIFEIIPFPPFNHQTIIWNVGRNGLVSWPATLESVTSIMSSRFTVLYSLLWFLTCTEIVCESSCTVVWFVVILWLFDTRFRDPLRKNIQCWSTDSNYWCSQVCNVLFRCIVTIVRPDYLEWNELKG